MSDFYKNLSPGKRSTNFPDDIKEHKYNPLREGDIRLLKLHAVHNVSEATEEAPLVAEIIVSGLLNDSQASVGSSQHEKEEESVEGSAKNEQSSKAQQQSEPIDNPEYDALSYVWGGAEPRSTDGRIHRLLFLVNPRDHWEQLGQWSYIRISENLEAALKSFRKEVWPQGKSLELYLWIDAVCINQKDSNERSTQIGRMADIYKEAAQVRVWLGNENDESQKAFKFIRHILSMELFDRLVEDTVTAPEWDAFRSLLQMSWFKRRWIVQEIAFARKAAVYCGTAVIPWKNLAASISLFVDARYELRTMFQGSSTTSHNPDYLGEVNSYSAKTLVDCIFLMFRRSGNDSIMKKLLSLESLLTTLTPFEARDPHDSIYAIMHLAADAAPASVHSTSDSLKMSSTASGSVSLQEVDSVHARRRNSEYTISGRERMISPDSISNEEAPQGQLSVPQVELPQIQQSAHLVPGAAPSRSRSRGRTPSPGAARRRAERRKEGAGKRKIKKFNVDYNQSVFKLCREVMDWIITQSHSLDIICKPWVPEITLASECEFYKVHKEDLITLPSWIQSLKKRIFGLDPVSNNKRYIRVAADPLVGTDSFGKKPYSACADLAVPRGYGSPYAINERLLKTRGFVLDVIEEVADKALNGIIPNGWLSTADWNNTEEDPPDSFWRTLVANRKSTSGPEQPPHHWPNACKWAFKRKTELGNLNPEQLINNVYGVPSRRILLFLERMRAVVWNRKLFKTRGYVEEHDEGVFWGPLLGLGPAEIREGDLICILYGCSVPVILRPTLHKKPKPSRKTTWEESKPTRRATSTTVEYITTKLPGQTSVPAVVINGASASPSSLQSGTTTAALPNTNMLTYTLVGECYIHAFMDGEAFNRNENEARDQDFVLGCSEVCNCGCS